MLRVVGIAPDEQVEIFDGQGQGCVGCLQSVQDGCAVIAWVRDLSNVLERPPLTMVLALTKGDAFSTAIRMVTELGVTRIVPLQAQRSIAKGDKQVRWQKIAEAAAAQSKRLSVPAIESLQTWTSIWAQIPEYDQRWVLHPPEMDVPSVMPITEPTTVFIGPEGGFTEPELQWMREHGGEYRSLGPLVLKADTAAVVACAGCLTS